MHNQIYEEIKERHNLWELFTKKEEYSPIQLDREGRFSYKYSNHKNVLQPVVSEYLIGKGFYVEYPEQKKFAIVLTHDIDDIYVRTRHILLSFFNFFRYGNTHGFLPLIKGWIDKSKSPYLNFKKIIQLEKKYNAVSSFYFLAEDNVSGFTYNVEDIEDEIGQIIDEGCEIGYHTGYYAYDDLNKIIEEKRRLEGITNRKIIGVRNHALRFKTPESWEILSKAGFKYDTSYHYHDMVGFRNGMCHPFYPFNLTKKRRIDILEIPLIVSDIALRSFMKIEPYKSWKIIKYLIDIVEKNRGVLTILWHNWTFSLPVSCAAWFGKEWTKLYEKILDYGTRKNAWLTNCRKLWEFEKKVGILKRG
ncbi:MAG: polysaccharide deacetylase family protein [Methanomicrobia archaeon]|nr:polysaccharide deacetylase family protein [Methanomicrobia archaeon]